MQMAKPKLDTLGRILDEPNAGWYILVENADHDGIKSAEGYDEYYIFIVKYNAPKSKLIDVPDGWLGYDSWCEDWKHVEQFFKGYEIEWLEGEEIFFGHRYYYKNNPRS